MYGKPDAVSNSSEAPEIQGPLRSSASGLVACRAQTSFYQGQRLTIGPDGKTEVVK